MFICITSLLRLTSHTSQILTGCCIFYMEVEGNILEISRHDKAKSSFKWDSLLSMK